jgi:hypothetical protein
MGLGTAKAVALALALVAATGCATLRCPAEGGRPWREITTAHFQIVTDLDADAAREAAVRFERVRHVVGKTFPIDPKGRLPVVVTNADFGFDGRHDGRSGLVSEGGALLLVRFRGQGPNGRIDRGNSFARAYTDYAAEGLFGGPPRWLAVGLASYLGQLRFDEDGRSATLGHESAASLDLVRHEGTLLPLTTLWRWDGQTETGMEEARRNASSWFWVSYLMRNESSRFYDFLHRISLGQEAHTAFEKVFPNSEMLERERRAQLDFRRWFIEWPLQRVEIPPEVGETLAVRELGAADFHVLRARMEATGLSELPEEEREARRTGELAQARQHDPSALVPGLEALSSAPADQRLGLARALVQAHPDSGMAHLALATSLWASEGNGDAAQTELAAAAARMKADPIFHAMLADQFLVDQDAANRLAALAGADAPAAEVLSSAEMKEMLFRPVFERGLEDVVRCGGKDGAAVLTVRISAAGRVESAELQGSSRAVARCLDAAGRAWRIPPLFAGGATFQKRFAFKKKAGP